MPTATGWFTCSCTQGYYGDDCGEGKSTVLLFYKFRPLSDVIQRKKRIRPNEKKNKKKKQKKKRLG